MRYKSIKTLFKLFVIIALVLTTAACGGNDRYNKYMKIVKKEAKVFEVIGNIQEDSVVMSDDGILTFNSVTSDGVVIPFVATGVRYENGVLIFTPQGKVDALKSVGQILAYHPIVSEPGDYWNSLDLYGSYTFSEVTEVDSVSVLTSSTSSSKNTFSYDEKNGFIEMFSFLPNFIGLKADRINNVDEFTLTKLNVYYTTDTYTTGIKYLTVDEKSFVAQLDGYLYDASNEGMFDVETGIFDFYLVAVPDVYDEDEFDLEKILSTGNYRTVYGIEGETMVVGDLKDAQGNVLDKNHAKVEKGMTLDIHFGDNTQVLSLPVVERYENAKTMKELLPNVNSSSIGDLNVLVIPINWSDEEATDDKLQTMKEMMGRVSENGSVVDYTTDTESLSSYYDKSSYGQLRITAHFTDWYQSEYAFAEMKYENLSKERYVESNKSAEPERITYAQDIFSWVHDTQNIDKEVFDQDGNQLYDAVIFLNAGDVSQDDGYSPLSFTGGYMQSSNYTGVGLSDGSNLGLNAYASIHTALGANTVIHEFGHLLGLIDYYD
ncbi:MAG: hypothetical protein IKY26_01020, partial [Erysipelotrichaceae bacterium]|nr:hypothetical protein [Erysipelotrichaceae bacterium]